MDFLEDPPERILGQPWDSCESRTGCDDTIQIHGSLPLEVVFSRTRDRGLFDRRIPEEKTRPRLSPFTQVPFSPCPFLATEKKLRSRFKDLETDAREY